MRIVALGTSCVDVYPQKETVTPGGEALNIAAHLSVRPDCDAYLMGAVGQDDYAESIRGSLRHYRANTDRLVTLPGDTAHHIIRIDESGDRYFEEGAWHGGVSMDFRFADTDRTLIRSADAVITTLWEPNLRELVELRRESGFLIAVDFNEQLDLADWDDVLPEIDVAFSGAGATMIDEFERRSESGETMYVVTLGPAGSVAFTSGERFDCEAVLMEEVVDTTGCGDCYQGTFLAEYANHRNIRRAMKAASAAAAQVTGYVGGFPAHPVAHAVARRESFDAVAGEYDAVRPRFPAELFAWLSETTGFGRGSRWVEIAPGTGQATRGMLDSGYIVDAIELGPHLAERLRTNTVGQTGLSVHVGDFESWTPPPDTRYDGVLCATAFHWLDQTVALAKCSRLTGPGGYLAVLYHEYPDAPTGALKAAYAELSRWSAPRGKHPVSRQADRRAKVESMIGSGLYTAPQIFEHETVVEQTPQIVLRGFRTQSSYLSLPADARASLDGELERIFAAELEPLQSRQIATCYLSRAL